MEKRQFFVERGLQFALASLSIGFVSTGVQSSYALVAVTAMLATLPIFWWLHRTGRWFKPRSNTGVVGRLLGVGAVLSVWALFMLAQDNEAFVLISRIYPLVLLVAVIAYEYCDNFVGRPKGRDSV